jgi:hypothetical protein
VLESGRSADCRETLTLHPQSADTGGLLRLVFVEGPCRYVERVWMLRQAGPDLGRY